MKHFASPRLLFGAKKWSPASGIETHFVVRRVSPGRINVVLEQNMLFLVNLNPEFLS